MNNVKATIPIFIITFNRLECLKKSIQSYKKIKYPITLVIHDNNSTYKPLLQYLKDLEKCKEAKVYYNRGILHDRTKSGPIIWRSVKEWYLNNNSPYYIVTDPDISFCQEDNYDNIIELYMHILSTENSNKVECVGPMLRIDDIPDYYPGKKEAVKRHYDQFWHKKALEMEWNGENIQYQYCDIATTFAMYRKGFTFQRITKGIRTYQPYWARHLDWYINPKNISQDQIIYAKTCKNCGFWGGIVLRKIINNK